MSCYIAKKKVIIKGNSNTDDNLTDRIAKFNNDNALSTGRVYRIPLRYLVDVGPVNFPTAFNVKFTFNLEQNRNKLFETNGAVANLANGNAGAIPTAQPDADIYFYNTPYIQYEQIKLNDTFNKYITKALQSERVLRTGIKPNHFKKHMKSTLVLNLV